MGGWPLGATLEGCQSKYALTTSAMVNLTPVPDGLTASTPGKTTAHDGFEGLLRAATFP